ncbi:hypothetical protein L1887_34837 [Cichorium endivia]|nr:hypothetical protein L1887_34837 [Cichorium endivia]
MTPPPCSLGKRRLFGSYGGARSAHSTGAVGGSDPSSTDPHRHQKPPPSGRWSVQRNSVGNNGKLLPVSSDPQLDHVSLSRQYLFPSQIAWFRFRFRLVGSSRCQHLGPLTTPPPLTDAGATSWSPVDRSLLLCSTTAVLLCSNDASK